MKRYRSNPLLILICISLTIAFALAVLPWPDVLRSWRPNFVLWVIIYWLTRSPEVIGVGGAWCLGLIYDGIIGCPLGIHALSFTLCAAMLLWFYPRWRLLLTSQQILIAFLLTMLEQVIVSRSQGMF